MGLLSGVIDFLLKANWPDEARPLCEEAIRRAQADNLYSLSSIPSVFTLMQQLARTYQRSGRPRDAVAILEDRLRVVREKARDERGEINCLCDLAEGHIEAVFFFVDPLTANPHDPDIQGLLRICNVHNVPLATNAATASFIISTKAL